MVGLSIVLETQKRNSNTGGVISQKTPQVLNKTAVLVTTAMTSAAVSAYNRPVSRRGNFYSESYFPYNAFLEHCFLCKQRLLPGKDIYMYKGDRAFCSVECRSRQMFMDEEEISLKKKENCSLVAIKTKPSSSSSSSSYSSYSSSPSPPPSAGSSRQPRGPRNGAGGFAY